MVVDFDKSLPLCEAGHLPPYDVPSSTTGATPRPPRPSPGRVLLKTTFVALLGFLALATLVSHRHPSTALDSSYRLTPNPHLQHVFARSLDRCKQIAAPAGPPPYFHTRSVSDRFEHGTPDILIRNATIWTGEHDGHHVLEAHDVHLSNGIIKKITKATNHLEVAEGVQIINAAGRWLTPGLVDMHVHVSVSPSPSLSGLEDTNSIGSNVNPWLRTVDALNQHDTAFKTSIAGGVTAGLVLPGSANSIGGQTFPLKYRQVSSLTPSDRLIEPPASLAKFGQGRNSSSSTIETLREYEALTGMTRNDSSSSWRYSKSAQGENPRRVYSKTRMDTAWDLRQIYDEARSFKQKQDDFCAKAEPFVALNGLDAAPTAESDATFPESLRLEMLIDTLRDKVKVNCHIYSTLDFDAFVRLSNEFEFKVAAFHHAHEAPFAVDLLVNKTYGETTPAVAIFSTNANYKTESSFGMPFAGAILDSYNITTIYKSDHPVTDSRRILNQAAQAHSFGLRESAALRSVISAPAERLGLDHRIGYVRQGWDADLVLWNNHPLAIGATPVEVIIDGIAQLGKGAHTPAPFFAKDAAERGAKVAPPAPRSANFTEAIEEVKRSSAEILGWEKAAFPTARKAVEGCTVLYNVSKVYSKGDVGAGAGGFTSIQVSDLGGDGYGMVVVDAGKVVCQGKSGSADDCAGVCPSGPRLDLQGGVVTPGLTSYGSDLGLTDIVGESQASDGTTLDPLTADGAATQTAAAFRRWPLARAVDGLQWGGNDLKRARASGVTSSVVMPQSNTFFSGVSVRFDTGAATVLDDGAIKEEEVGVHVTLNHNGQAPSISEQIGWIRQLLSDGMDESHSTSGTVSSVWSRVAKGELPLIVTALKASHIATLLKLSDTFPHVRLVISGGTESHLVAAELATRNVPVILIPQTWARTYDELHALPGPPLSSSTTLGVLLDAGVKVALKVEEAWQASNLLSDSVRAALETDGKVDKKDALGLVSSAVEDVLQLKREDSLVFWDGEPFEYGVKVIAIAGQRGVEVVL